ncbi:unnamed protein product [Ectocarpus sp. CCAP 1310/34]|nr:unnamed protein product [Ectocarpus sp. CCAP 1310/34]
MSACLLLVAKDTGSKPAAHLMFFRSTEKKKDGGWAKKRYIVCLSNSKLLAMRGGSGATAHTHRRLLEKKGVLLTASRSGSD